MSTTETVRTRVRGRLDPAPAYLAAFVVLGLTLSVVGPSIGLLETQVGTDTAGISVVFAAQGAGYLLGALVLGRGYDRGAGNRLLAGGLVAAGLALAVLPVPGSVAVVAAVFALVGLFGGAVDVGGNTLLGWSRGADSAPWLAGLHLCFGIGALTSPLLVAASDAAGDDLALAAGVGAVLALGAAAWLLATRSPALPAAPVDAVAAGPATDRRGPAMVAVFLGLYVGAEVGYGGWVHTYAEDVGLGKAAATGVTTLFWAMFTTGRLLTIAAARRVPAATLLSGSCTAAVGAAALLVLGDGRAAAVWPATALLGLALAPQFPMVIAYAGQHLRVTGSTMSWFVGAAGAGGMVLPWAIGMLADGTGPGAVPATVLVALLVMTGWWALIRRRLEPDRRRGPGPAARRRAPRPSDPAAPVGPVPTGGTPRP